jgi:hypothetical protein
MGTRTKIGAVVAAALVVGGAVALTAVTAGASARPAVGPAATADDWAELQGILSGIQGTAKAPIPNVTTGKFTPGMLLGNGDIGVIAGGGNTSSQKFFFGKGDFWGTAWNSGHSQLVTAILSLGSLNISSPTASANPGPVYRMTQDILDAEVRSTVQLGNATVTMRSYTADSDNTFVTELSNAAGSPAVTLDVALAMPSKDAHTNYPTTVSGTGGTIVATRRNNLTGANDFHAEAAIAVRPVGVGFSSTRTSGNTVTGRFTLNGGSTVQLASVFRSDARAGGGAPSPATLAGNATGAVNALTNAGVASLLANHRAWWKDYWLKSVIQVNDPTTMAYWYGALYAMGSAARQGKVLADMNGPWVSSDFTQFPRYWYNYNV